MGIFEKKIVLITGSASGIGRAIALAYAREGARVGLIDIDPIKLREVREEIETKGSDCKNFSVDITNRPKLKEAIKEFFDHFGRIDVLVNAAGVWKEVPFIKMSDEEMDRMLSVNFIGTYNCIKSILPDMLKRKKGKIISIVSIAGKIGSGTASHYAATKGALIAFSKSIAIELGPSGINVNAIAPGLIDTPMGKATGKYGIEKYLNRLPIGRMGKPDEVAELSLFLGSSASDYITGQVWNICGGYLMD